MSLVQEAAALRTLTGDFDRWDDLLALILRSFASMDGVIDPPSSAHRLTPETLRQKSGDETGIAAFLGGELVGCVFLAERPDHVYVGKLAVDPRHQGRGIGRLLMRRAEELALASGRPALELQTRVELTANHATFARLGFVETGRTAHAGYDRPTTVTMRKVLA